MKKKPGKIINAGMLKDFDKYIRTDDENDSSNFVMKRRLANNEDISFKKLPPPCWKILKDEYGCDYEIKREKEKSSYSYWQKYKFEHSFVKVFILPNYSNFTEDEVASTKPIKIYFT